MAMSITDNRFETIERAKKDLLEATNIETSPDEMKVLNDFLYRCWQMGWLKQYEEGKTITEWIPVSERLPEEAFGCLVTVDGYNPITGDSVPNILPYPVGYDGERWNDYDGEEIPYTVLAWTPLPDPSEKEWNEDDFMWRDEDE